MTDTDDGGAGKAPKRARSARAKAVQELRILEELKSGLGVNEIALREKLSPRRVQQLIAKSLGRHDRPAGGEFFELQTRRLNEALLVSYTAMSGGNLKAVDRVVTIVRELDRYHRPEPRSDRGSLPPPELAPAAAPLALEAPAPVTEHFFDREIKCPVSD